VLLPLDNIRKVLDIYKIFIQNIHHYDYYSQYLTLLGGVGQGPLRRYFSLKINSFWLGYLAFTKIKKSLKKVKSPDLFIKITSKKYT